MVDSLRYAIVLLLASAILAGGCSGGEKESSPPPAESGRTARAEAGPEDVAAYQTSVEDWHARRIERLRAPDGWLSLVALAELRPGENEVGSAYGQAVRLPEGAPEHLGTLVVGEDGHVAFRPALEVEVDGSPTTATVDLRSDAEGEPTQVARGSLLFYVIRRGDLLFARVKDGESEILESFEGIERFPVDPAWRIRARWEPYDPPRTLAVPNVLGQVDEEPLAGAVVFDHDGEEVRLHPTGDPAEGLFLVFGDATNEASTYGGGRFLSLDPPGEDGTVVVDFNRAYNPPCVFTPYATCPLPPEGNVLPFAVTAGEKVWGHGH